MDSKKDNNIIRIILILVNLMIPIVFVVIHLLIQRKSIDDIIPVLGDELWWWKQADAVSKYGSPLGYWGYNGGIATVGTFAAWGMMPVMPYGFFAKIFGWNYYSFIYANLFYQIVGIGVFILLTKPRILELNFLGIINAGQTIRNAYLFIAMQESVRSATGLIAAAMIIWLFRNIRQSGWKYIVAEVIIGLYLIFVGQLYLIWTLFFLPYYDIIHRRIKNRWIRIAIVSIETILTIYILRKLVNITCSPYLPTNLTFIARIKRNIIDYINLLFGSSTKMYFKWFHVGMIFVVASIVIWVIIRRKRISRTNQCLVLGSCCIPIVFLFGHVVMYDTTMWTFTRGMAMGLFVFCFCIAILKQRTPTLVVSVWCCVCLALFYIGSVDNTFVNKNRFATEEWKKSITETKLLMEEMDLFAKEGRSEDPWDYTVSSYIVSSPIILSMPSGYSFNDMMDGKIRDNVGWIMVGKEKDPIEADRYRNELLSLGYTISAESEKLIVFRKKTLTLSWLN